VLGGVLLGEVSGQVGELGGLPEVSSTGSVVGSCCVNSGSAYSCS